MKTFILSSLLILIVSCGGVPSIKHQEDIEQIVDLVLAKQITVEDAENQIKDLGYIDATFHLNDNSQSEYDSTVAIQLTKGVMIFGPNHENFLYDFASKPKNSGSVKHEPASYERIQISERWYHEETGFD